VQQIGVRRRVLEVARIGVAEDLDGALGEVRALVDVVDVGQSVVVVDDAQDESCHHDQAEHGECRALGAQAVDHGADGSFDPSFPMKLIIQIPCLNEEETLPVTLRDLPREVAGFDTVEWLIIDDGSTDRTIAVAREHGVDHIVRLTNNKGLASGFQAGLDACLKLGADVVVNTDADNQYDGRDVATLVGPILAGDADMVVGDRQVSTIEHFSPAKKSLQRLGSWVVRQASSTDVPDTTSGFRAYNREAALSLQVVSKFTYTLETIIQAGKMTVAIDHVPVRTNPKLRDSRLFPSMWTYIRRNGVSIFRIYALYEPLRVFMSAALLAGFAALIVWGRFFYFWAGGHGEGHVQSLILGAVLFNVATVLAALGVLGDLISGQRTTLQRIFERVRRVELELGVAPSHYEPGDPERPGAQPPTTGARAAKGNTEDREAVQL
jgi:glycosyltransferase involved in cell wall biosynthesis